MSLFAYETGLAELEAGTFAGRVIVSTRSVPTTFGPCRRCECCGDKIKDDTSTAVTLDSGDVFYLDGCAGNIPADIGLTPS